MRRRDFIALLGGATVCYPLPTSAESVVPVVGFLDQGSAKSDAAFAGAFRKGLNEIVFVSEEDVAIQYRWAEGHYDRLPQLAADLVAHKVSVIAASYAPAARAAMEASSVIPIVFVTGSDPISSPTVWADY
jgi:putative ABC transport system substrate-binding protein